MQLKPITAIIVLLLVVASLLVAGCSVSSDSSTGSVSTDYPTSGRSKLAEAAVKYRQDDFNAANTKYLDTQTISFDVKWISDTKAQIHEVTKNTKDYTTYITDYTITHFPSTDAATTYRLNSGLTYDASSSTLVTPLFDYFKVTGKTPTVYHMYQGDWVGLKRIAQYDSLIVEETLTIQKPN